MLNSSDNSYRQTNMDVQRSNLKELVAKNVTSFYIPPYQRAYAWRKAEITRFFGDLCRIIESELDEECKDKLEHFFGTLVVKNEPVGIAGTRTIIIDGQQRVTTALILLMAVRDLLTDLASRELITNTYLINSSSTFEDKIKLKQVTKDWDAYRALVLGQPAIPGEVTEAYNTFAKLLSDYCAGDERVSPEHFVMALGRVNVAVIILDERAYKGEDPQIIFETLNSLGRPLTFSDLIRNFILLNMDSQRQTEAYEKIWYPEIEEPLGESTSSFLRDYLQLKLATSLKSISDNNTKELYQQFKDYATDNWASRDELMTDIVSYIDCYRYIIDKDFTGAVSTNAQVKELMRNIFQDIGTEAFKPFVLGLLYHHCHAGHNEAQLISLLTTIRTYLIRRRVFKLTQGENKAFPRFCDRIEEVYSGKISLIDLLSSQMYRLRMPNDVETRSMLEGLNFYKELASYAKLILGKIEEHRAKVAVDFRDPKITIEHIMPQTITTAWRGELGEDADEIHARYLHNIGNLILTEFNVEMSNTSFENKKKRLASSSLAYRLDIMDKERWTLESILSHQKVMIDAFIDTFPLPDEYQRAENWKQRVAEVHTDFSPLDDGIHRLLAGKKPVSIRLDDVTAQAHSWQEVFLNFIKLVTQKRTTLQYLKDNQKRLFNRDNALLTWRDLRQDPGLVQKRYYKNLAGEFPFLAVKPSDEDEFVHIDISSSTCICRIAKTMTDLGMNKDSVSITIQKKQSGESDTSITSLPLIPNS